MGSFHYRGLSIREVEDRVFAAVADGASHVFTYVVEEIGHTEGVEKVDALIRASRQVKRMLDRGTTRPNGLAEFYLLFVLAQETLGETVTLQAG